ncbi:MAG: mechanosensitive ion channel family protein [Magnetospirillum sp.]|nr:mechanosensitive ion channel family protein [Magnetospirillum sp.]
MMSAPLQYWIYLGAIVLAILWVVAAGLRSDDRTRRRLSALGLVLIGTTIVWVGGPYAAKATGSPLLQGIVEDVARVFGVLWWLILGFIVLVTLERFVWRGLEARGIATPKLLKDVIRALVAVLSAFGVISAAFDQPLTGVLAASGVLAVVIGFAMQSTLADLFSGIAINIERPYRVGHWIQIDNALTGQVVEINWRATRLRTADGNTVVMPNSKLAAAQIVNYDEPAPRYRTAIQVPLDGRVPPGIAKDALTAAALKSMRVLTDPAPFVETKEIRDASVLYEVRYWIDSYADDTIVRDEVASSIWYALDAAGISPGQPLRTDSTLGERVLEHVDLFRAIEPALRARVAAAARHEIFHAGDDVVRQGDTDRSLFVVARGVFEVSLESGGVHRPVARLGTGDFFGEMSLLTGAPRSARVTALCDTLALEISAEALTPVLQAHPEFARRLGEIVLERKQMNDAALRALTPAARRDAKRSQVDEFLAKMRDFFGLG